jgi:PST family polysaccharide transporter
MTTTPAEASGVDPIGAPATNRTLFRNASTLMGAQAIGLVVPLVTIPYLARVLGPAAWGPVFAAQALGNWLLMLLEFGFELSGTRAVARARVAPESMPEVVHGVQSAKTVLVVAALPLVALGFAVPTLRAQPALLIWAFLFAAFRGFSPLWFFQGIEQQSAAVLVDMGTRALAALGVFFVVHHPSDAAWVIALQAIFSALSLIVLTAWMARHVALCLPARAAALRTLREGRNIFAIRASTGLLIQANTLILSAMASAATVAFFGGAERIIRAAINLLQPLTQVFLPRVSYLHATDTVAARRMIRHTLIGVGAIGAVMGLAAFFGAPLLVHLILGSGYEPAIPVLRLFGLLPFLVAVNSVVGIYWALPFGHERALLRSIVAGGVSNVVLALVLVPRWGATGMAASAIVAEALMLGAMLAVFVRHSGRA